MDDCWYYINLITFQGLWITQSKDNPAYLKSGYVRKNRLAHEMRSSTTLVHFDDNADQYRQTGTISGDKELLGLTTYKIHWNHQLLFYIFHCWNIVCLESPSSNIGSLLTRTFSLAPFSYQLSQINSTLIDPPAYSYDLDDSQ